MTQKTNRRLRNGGQTARYRHVEAGVNSRLDEMQAAVLRARLPFLAGWTARRRALATRYREALAPAAVRLPAECDPGHVYHLFPVLTDDRDGLQAHLEDRGVGTLIHYPIPVHRQEAFASLPPADCPETDRLCREVCSLPLHPHLSDVDALAVTDAVLHWTAARETPAP